MIMAERDRTTNWGRVALLALGGGVLGFVSVSALDLTLGLDRLGGYLGVHDIAAATLGILALLNGLLCFLLSFDERQMRRAFGVPDDEADARDEVMLARWSALGFLAYGLFLSALAWDAALGGVAALLAAGSLAAAIAINWLLWTRYDELWRQITSESAAMAFAYGHYVLMAWVAAAVLLPGFGFGPLDLLALVLGAYWAAAIRLVIGRGLTATRV